MPMLSKDTPNFETAKADLQTLQELLASVEEGVFMELPVELATPEQEEPTLAEEAMEEQNDIAKGLASSKNGLTSKETLAREALSVFGSKAILRSMTGATAEGLRATVNSLTVSAAKKTAAPVM